LALVLFQYLTAPVVQAKDLAYVVNFRSGTLSILRLDGEGAASTLPLPASPEGSVQQLPGENPDGAVAGLAIGGPVAVALSADGRIAYVVQSGSPGALLVIDTEKRRVEATIPLEKDPFGLALAPGGKEIYVTNFESDSVTVIDTATRRVAATVAAGQGPNGIAVGRDRAFVANTKATTVSVIDVSTRKLTGEIEVGQTPFAVALTGDSLLVANSGSDSVSIVRLSDNVVAATVAVGKTPVAIAVSPDGKRAFVAHQGNEAISVIDVANHRLITSVALGYAPFSLAVSGDGKRLVIADTPRNAVSIVDTESMALVRSVPVGTAPFGVAVGPAPSSGSACHCAVGAAPGGSALIPLAAACLFGLWRAALRRRTPAQSV
jgi:YVTN family beta-propeller protein